MGLWTACELFKSEPGAPTTTLPLRGLDDKQLTVNGFAVEEVACLAPDKFRLGPLARAFFEDTVVA